MLDAQRLAVLAEVAHAGSIASAAQRLAFTPSAVSQQIGKLERDVGCRLLHRHPRGVTLTPVGQALLSHAETVIGELRTAEQTVQAMLGAQPSRLAVGTFASAGQSLVPRALARFRRRHPDVALALHDLEPPDGYGLVTSGDLDLLITHRYPGVPLPDPRGLTRQLLMHDPLRLVLPASHPRAHSPQITIAELTGQEWISGSAGIPNRVCLELAARWPASSRTSPTKPATTRSPWPSSRPVWASHWCQPACSARPAAAASRSGSCTEPPQPGRSTWCTANDRPHWSPT